jgi:hypothetical protein
MEGWKGGIGMMEYWKGGKMELEGWNWNDGILEGWKDGIGRVEYWKGGKMEYWKVGRILINNSIVLYILRAFSN